MHIVCPCLNDSLKAKHLQLQFLQTSEITSEQKNNSWNTKNQKDVTRKPPNQRTQHGTGRSNDCELPNTAMRVGSKVLGLNTAVVSTHFLLKSFTSSLRQAVTLSMSSSSALCWKSTTSKQTTDTCLTQRTGTATRLMSRRVTWFVHLRHRAHMVVHSVAVYGYIKYTKSYNRMVCLAPMSHC